jgi:adenosylcobinamide-GDP ribazoletransferase
MRWLKGFWMALGMFCGIPLPFHVWDGKLNAIAVVSLPLVGAIIGVIWWASGLILLMPNLPIVMVAAVLAVVPFFAAGFIHLDGYMDTSDALLSRRPLEEKLRILKDPRVGAFAVVMLAILFLMQFAAVYTIAERGKHLALLITICVISRSCSALSVFVLRHTPESNYIAMLGRTVTMRHKAFIVIIALTAIALSFLYAGFIGLIVSASVVTGYSFAIKSVYKNFDGISGDLLGYSMVISELCGLIALALLQGVEISI